MSVIVIVYEGTTILMRHRVGRKVTVHDRDVIAWSAGHVNVGKRSQQECGQKQQRRDESGKPMHGVSIARPTQSRQQSHTSQRVRSAGEELELPENGREAG